MNIVLGMNYHEKLGQTEDDWVWLYGSYLSKHTCKIFNTSGWLNEVNKSVALNIYNKKSAKR